MRIRNSCRGIVLSLFLCLACFAATGFPTQQNRQGVPGTIRVRVSLVPIDVIVTDQKNRPVLDLAKDDFTILENGKPQEIRHFILQTMTAMAPAPTQGKQPLLRKVPTVELEPQSKRTFLILMGRGRFQTPFKCVDSLIRFVRNELLPQDLVAVFAYNRATDFTTNHEKIAQVLEQYKKIHEKIESRLAMRFSGLAAIYGSKAIPKTLQPDIDQIFNTQGEAGSRQVIPGRVTLSGKMAQESTTVSAGIQKIEAADENASLADNISPFDRLEVDTLTDLSFEDFVSTSAMTSQDIQNIFTSIEYLRYMEGEKHLLFFSQDGLFLPRMEYDKSVAAMANDARVMIDTFQTSGVFLDSSALFSAAQPASNSRIRGGGAAPAPRRSGNMSRTFALSSLRTISQLTGGQVSIHENLPKALTNLNEVTRAQYLLGYYPANNHWDGSYRKVTVHVSRPGLKISYRHGYYARDELRPFDREEFLSYSRIAAAAGYAEAVKDIVFQLSTTKDENSGQPEVRVDLKINASTVRFQETSGIYSGKLHITVFYTDEKGRSLEDLWQIMDMNLHEATYLRVQQEGISYTTKIPLRKPGGYIKVVVYDSGSDKVGSQVTRVH